MTFGGLLWEMSTRKNEPRYEDNCRTGLRAVGCVNRSLTGPLSVGLVLEQLVV